MLDKPENGHLDSRAGLLKPWFFQSICALSEV
jgi:hypothetical protein